MNVPGYPLGRGFFIWDLAHPSPTRLESVPSSHSAVSTCLRPIDAIEQRIVQFHGPSFDPVSWQQLHTPIRSPSSLSGGLLDGAFGATTANTELELSRSFSRRRCLSTSLRALLLACRSFPHLGSFLHPGLARSCFFRPLLSTAALSVKP